MLFLISYKFTDANAQDKGSKMLKEWYEKGEPQNRPEGYDVKSWIFLPQHGNGYSVVDVDSLESSLYFPVGTSNLIFIILTRFNDRTLYPKASHILLI